MSDSTSLLTQLTTSQAGKELTVNELMNAVSHAATFGRQQSSSGLSFDIFGGRAPVNGVSTAIANLTVLLQASRTQQVEADFVSTTTAAISGITLANPCVVTSTAHPFTVGQVLWIEGIVGTTQLNSTFARVTAIAANTVTLNISSVGFTAWSSAGTLARVTSGAATALKIGKGLDLGNVFVTQIPIYQVVAGASTVTSYTDQRPWTRLAPGRLARVKATDANTTLTAAEAFNDILDITSSVSLTLTRDVILPLTAKSYIVFNGTTGAQALRFIGATGTGVTVANGMRATIYADGTNIVRATADI